MIYVIGVHHSIQHNGGDLRHLPGLAALREQFRYYLMSTARELAVSVLAEELNEDVLALFHASESQARSAAGALGIPHVFCEPDSRTRSSLGFTKRLQRKHHFVRERLWYDKMADYRDGSILFICGANHVSTFPALARSKGQEAEVLTAYYGKRFFANITDWGFCLSLCRNPWAPVA